MAVVEPFQEFAMKPLRAVAVVTITVVMACSAAWMTPHDESGLMFTSVALPALR
jgi:hypothetical protein